MSRDIAQKDHWDSIYKGSKLPVISGWEPNGYCALVLKEILLCEIRKVKPGRILEIGCGNSVWLPYIAKWTGAEVFGIDYSEEGCKLARERLNLEGIRGTVFCGDIFKISAEEIGQFDFVYSLGVAEHFTDLNFVIGEMSKFVKKGGVLLTEVPNLRFLSIHYILAYIWQPKLLAKHVPTSKKKLIKAYNYQSFEKIHGSYIGVFSLDIIAWELYPRWPWLAKKIVPFIRKLQFKSDKFFSKIRKVKGNSFTSPFIYVTGIKTRS